MIPNNRQLLPEPAPLAAARSTGLELGLEQKTVLQILWLYKTNVAKARDEVAREARAAARRAARCATVECGTAIPGEFPGRYALALAQAHKREMADLAARLEAAGLLLTNKG